MMAADFEMTVKRTPSRNFAPREFHVSRGVREAYGLDESLFTVSGNVVFANFHAARTFAHRLNEHRPAERAVSASDIYALGLIDEALHLVVARHRRESAPQLWADAITLLGEEIGQGPLDELLLAFVDEFPPTAVFKGEVTEEEYRSVFRAAPLSEDEEERIERYCEYFRRQLAGCDTVERFLSEVDAP